MTTESSSPQVRYATLRDYLRVLQRYWIMILAITVVGGIAGFIYADTQSASYRATAEVSFQDPFQQLGVVGLSSNQPQTPGELAAVAMELVTGPSVSNQVNRELNPSGTTRLPSHSITTQLAVPSNLLQIIATSSDPRFAADLANTTAQVLSGQDNAQVRTQFSRLASTVQARIANLTAHGATAFNSTELQYYQGELARLQTLSSFAKTAQVARPATTPTRSTSESTLRSTLLGLLFGLILGVVVAFLRDSLDRRLRNGRDVQTSFGLPVLGHVRNQAMGRIAHIPDGSGGNRQVDVEAFRIIRRNLELLDPDAPPKTILVTSAVADEGKTTVAGSLAVAIASTGRRTLLIEADLRRPALASRLRVEQVPGLTDYLAGQATPQEVLRTVEFADAPVANGSGPSSNGHFAGGGVHRLVCIPSGSRTSRSAELIGASRFRELIEQVRDTYDAVVLDCTPLLPVSDTLEVLPHVDAVVLCVRESQTTRDQASAAKTALSRWPESRAGVVVTGIKPRGAGDEVAYAHAHSYA